MNLTTNQQQYSTRELRIESSSQACVRSARNSQGENAVLKTFPIEASDASISLLVRWLPLFVTLTYLNMTVLLLLIGPWNYPVGNPLLLYTFLLSSHLALFFGYNSVANREPRGYTGRITPNQLIILAVLVNSIVALPTSLALSGSFLPDVMGGLDNPGELYTKSQQLRLETSVVGYVRILLAYPIYYILPLGVYYFFRINRILRVLTLAVISYNICVYIAVGTNKYLADCVILSSWMFAASYKTYKLRLGWYVQVGIVALIAAGALGFFNFFRSASNTRIQAKGEFTPANVRADYDHWLIRDMDPETQQGIISLISYLTQGYYGLSLCMDKPFIPMCGIGHSMFLTRNAAKLTGDLSLEELSYAARLSKENDPAWSYSWTTIYPWIASDVSFLLTPFVVFIIGRGFALTWLDSVGGVNPFAPIAFAKIVNMIVFFPAHNWALAGGEDVVSFWLSIFFWLHFKSRSQKRCHSGKRLVLTNKK